jgi:hypothetical protein
MLALPTYKAVGIQTEKAADPALLTLNVDPPASHALSQKLLAIWGSPSDQKLGRNLISKLLLALGCFLNTKVVPKSTIYKLC